LARNVVKYQAVHTELRRLRQNKAMERAETGTTPAAPIARQDMKGNLHGLRH
jgi:hypothetical protein